MAQLSATSLISDPNLQAYYKLESTADSGPNARTLTNNNAATFTTAKYNNGANLGASNTNKSLSETNALAVAGDNISISLWVKLLAEITSSQWVFGMQSDETTTFTQYFLRYVYNAGSRYVSFIRNITGGASPEAKYTISLGTSSFFHLVGTYDGTNLKLYVNSVLQATQAASGIGGASLGHNTGFFIGADDQGAQVASALLDDVACFNRVLTPVEISTLFSDAVAATPALFFGQI